MKSPALIPFLILLIGLVWITMGVIHGTWYEILIGIAIAGFAYLCYRSQRRPPS